MDKVVCLNDLKNLHFFRIYVHFQRFYFLWSNNLIEIRNLIWEKIKNVIWTCYWVSKVKNSGRHKGATVWVCSCRKHEVHGLNDLVICQNMSRRLIVKITKYSKMLLIDCLRLGTTTLHFGELLFPIMVYGCCKETFPWWGTKLYSSVDMRLNI